MILVAAGNPLQLLARVLRAAQPQPADGGVQVVRVWRGKRFHRGDDKRSGGKTDDKKILVSDRNSLLAFQREAVYEMKWL